MRKSGNRVRITTQLIRSSDSSHLWSQTYDRDLQRHLRRAGRDLERGRGRAESAAAGARGPSGRRSAARMCRRPTRPTCGGNARTRARREDTAASALASFDEAIRLDPGYARAYVGKADALSTLASNAYLPFDTRFPAVTARRRRARSNSPRISPRHFWRLASFRRSSTGPARRAASAERALRLSPGSLRRAARLFELRVESRRHERAITAAEKAVELDPHGAAEAHVNLSGRPAVRAAVRASAEARRAPARSRSHRSARRSIPRLGWTLLPGPQRRGPRRIRRRRASTGSA